LDHRPGEETEEFQLKMKILHFREKQQKLRISAENENVAFQRKTTKIENFS
jgi:hypothetical protein